MTSTNKTVLVIGGHGFIGRHIVEFLRTTGAKVIIGTRTPRSGQIGSAEQRKIQLHKIRYIEEWDALLSNVDVVVNTVGILRPRSGESYEQVHHHAVASLAQACAVKKIRLVHLSALGFNPALNSQFLPSKQRGEQAIRAAQGDWLIVRPSLVDGAGGYGASWFRRVANWPVHLVPASSVGLLTPIDAKDLGEAVSNLALSNDSTQEVYELGGSQSFGLFEYLALLSGDTSRLRIKVPALIARVASHVCDLTHLTPFSYGHYELLKYDNCPSRNRLKEVLGREPTLIAANPPRANPNGRLGLAGLFS